MNSKIKTSLINLSKKHTVLRVPMRKALYAKNRLKYLADALTVKTRDDTVIFCAYNGKSYACSPKAIYEYMLSAPEYKDYKFIWIFKEPEKHKELAADPHTRIVKYHTTECNRALRQAKYWFFNFRALEHSETDRQTGIYPVLARNAPEKTRLRYRRLTERHEFSKGTERQIQDRRQTF